MPVNTRHPEYEAMLPKWQRMRDVSAGQDAIHGGGENYLPRLTGETDKAYLARIARTPFFEATWRTIEGLRGMLLRKAPVRKVSKASETMLRDVTKTGMDIDAFALKAVEEVLTVNRLGILVDHPPAVKAEGGRELTRTEVERMNLRPHMAMYMAENITNWEFEWVNNRAMLTRVVLEESAKIRDEQDRFAHKSEKRWRVLELDRMLIGGVEVIDRYKVEVYRKNDAGNDELLQGFPIFPTLDGKDLTEIPFYFIGSDDNTPAVDLPPLLGLANLNVSHYQTTADLELGAHRTALPTPYVAGSVTQQHDAQGNPVPVVLHMGGEAAWFLPGSDINIGMLEYTGSGLSTLENRLAVKERQMAVLGARMLEQQKAGVETAEAAGIHRSGEHSALSAIGASVSKGIAQALAMFDKWAGGDGVVEFKLNEEFFPAQLSAQDVTALVQAWQAGGLSHQELFEKFQKGGIVRDGKEFEEHETEIKNAPPPLAAAPLPVEDDEDEAA